MTATFVIKSCILCDDVRIERAGKEILIGVYPVGVTVPSLPWVAAGVIRLGVIWSGDGEANFKIRIISPSQAQSGETSGSGSAIWNGFISSIIVPIGFINLDIEGVYDISISVNDGLWERILQLPVYLTRN